MSKKNLQDSSKNFYLKYLKKYPQIRKWVEKEVEFVRLDNGNTFKWFDITEQIMKICPPPKKFLDLGCGPGARDSLYFQKAGYDVISSDVLPEILKTAVELNSSLKSKTKIVDISKKFPFKNQSFDLIFCIAAIQHIEEKSVSEITIPEVKRILKPGGYFLLIFKVGDEIKEMFDPVYKTKRTFRLYEPKKIVEKLKRTGFAFPQEEFNKPILFNDNRNIKTCLIFVQKRKKPK